MQTELEFQRSSIIKLKRTLIMAAFTIALIGAFAANAADEKPVIEEEAEIATSPKGQTPQSREQIKLGAARKVEGMRCRKPSQADKNLFTTITKLASWSCWSRAAGGPACSI
jgi:hypothetical protein